MFRNRTRYLVILVVAGALFVLLAAMVTSGALASYDNEVLAYFAGQLTPSLTTLFRAATWVGSIIVLAPLAAMIGYLCVRRGYRADSLLLFNSLTLAAVSARLLKYLFGRARPDAYPALVDTLTGLAFPSVHATQVVAFSLVVFLLLRRWRLLWRLLASLTLLFMTLVGLISRLYLQVHFPSDVLGGATLAIVCVTAAAAIQPAVTKPS